MSYAPSDKARSSAPVDQHSSLKLKEPQFFDARPEIATQLRMQENMRCSSRSQSLLQTQAKMQSSAELMRLNAPISARLVKPQSVQSGGVAQLTVWRWNGKKWCFKSGARKGNLGPPTRDGSFDGEIFDDNYENPLKRKASSSSLSGEGKPEKKKKKIVREIDQESESDSHEGSDDEMARVSDGVGEYYENPLKRKASSSSLSGEGKPEKKKKKIVREIDQESESDSHEGSDGEMARVSDSDGESEDLLAGVESKGAVEDFFKAATYKIELGENGKKLFKPFSKVKKGRGNYLSAQDYLDGYRSDDGYEITDMLRKDKPSDEVKKEIAHERKIRRFNAGIKKKNTEIKKANKKVRDDEGIQPLESLKKENKMIKKTPKSKDKYFKEGPKQDLKYKKTRVNARIDHTMEASHPRLLVAGDDQSTHAIGLLLDHFDQHKDENKKRSLIQGLKGADLAQLKDSKGFDSEAYKLGLELRAVAMFSDAGDHTGAGLISGYLIANVKDFDQVKKLFVNDKFLSQPGALPSQTSGAAGTAMFEMMQTLVTKKEVSFGRKEGTASRPKVDKAQALSEAGSDILTVTETPAGGKAQADQVATSTDQVSEEELS